MLSINNIPLPTPATLTLGYTGPAAGSLTLLTAQATWPGLTADALKGILSPTAGPFTLACPDPRTGAARGFPARLTAWLMLAVSGNLNKQGFVKRFGPAHASPNSGYPESALAAILNCRFGGTHDYFGKPVEKPYIGTNERPFTTEDMLIAININSNTELAMGLIVCLVSTIIH